MYLLPKEPNYLLGFFAFFSDFLRLPARLPNKYLELIIFGNSALLKLQHSVTNFCF